MNLDVKQVSVSQPNTPEGPTTEDMVGFAVRDFHKKRAHRMHILCALAGIAVLPNRLIRNPEWLQTMLSVGALLSMAAIVIAVARYFYFKGRPQTLVLPDDFMAAHPQLLKRIRQTHGSGDFEPKVLADLMVYGRHQ